MQGATSLPIDRINVARIRELLGRSAGKESPVYIFSGTGDRARQAALKFQSEGLGNIFIVRGGNEAWSDQNLPIERSPRKFSLQRKVLIAGGALILLMLAKGLLLHPLFLGLAGLVATGLIAYGIGSWSAHSEPMMRVSGKSTGRQSIAPSH